MRLKEMIPTKQERQDRAKTYKTERTTQTYRQFFQFFFDSLQVVHRYFRLSLQSLDSQLLGDDRAVHFVELHGGRDPREQTIGSRRDFRLRRENRKGLEGKGEEKKNKNKRKRFAWEERKGRNEEEKSSQEKHSGQSLTQKSILMIFLNI